MTAPAPPQGEAHASWLRGEPLRFTTARWLNRCSSVKRFGRDTTSWLKVLAYRKTGFYSWVSYGCDYPPTREWLDGHREELHLLQGAVLCCPPAGVFTVDVDYPGLTSGDDCNWHGTEVIGQVPGYAATRTAQLIGRDQAFTVRGDHYHGLVDARPVPGCDWPPQNKIAGADIKSKGFVPMPGSRHYSGDIYRPAREPLTTVPGTPELIAAIKADQADERERRRRKKELISEERSSCIRPCCDGFTRSSSSGSGGRRRGSAGADGSRRGGSGGNGAWAGGPAVNLAELVATGLPVGERNDLLLKVACSRYRFHGTGPSGHAAVMADIGAVLAATDCGGFWDSEIATTIDSAREFIEEQEQAEEQLRQQVMAWLGTREVA
jgi:hypothetical protein